MESVEKIDVTMEPEASGSVEAQEIQVKAEECEESTEKEVEKEIKQEVVESVVNEVVSRVEAQEAPKTMPEINLADIRKAKSIASIASSDAGDLSAFSDCDSSDFEAIVSDADSDVEFEQYLKETATRRQKNYIREHCWNMETKRSKRGPKSDKIDDEYEGLPDFEKLTISCPETAKLAKFGSVQSVVGCIAMIQPLASVNQILDLESVVFDKEGKSLGSVFDVIGTVKEALYCIRFGSKTEASEIPVGLEVFYAPSVEDFTKKLIDTNLSGAWKRRENVESDEDEAVFSDDEKEKAYRNKKNAAKSQENGGAGGGRKRNHNRSVRFEELGTGDNQRGGGGRGRGGHNHRGGRGRGRGGGGGFQWQQRSTMDSFNKSSGFSPGATSVQVPDMANQTQRPAQSTSDNPYAEFGCYDNRRK